MKGKFDFQNITFGRNNEFLFQSEMSPKFSTEAITESTAIYSIFLKLGRIDDNVAKFAIQFVSALFIF